MGFKSEIFISENDFRSRYQYSQSDLIGEGGFAQVYKAFDKQFNEYVALKFYNKNEQSKYDVLHEMKDSRRFSHNNIIRVHDAFKVKFEYTGGYSLIQVGVLEYANGGNLRDFINTKPSEKDFCKVLIGILNALQYLHEEKRIIHRDLSPENILMIVENNNWIPKLADFGISKSLKSATTCVTQNKSTELLGKVSYMAPEQFYPEKFGIKNSLETNVDLWAFGVILYEIFTNENPFEHENSNNPIKIIDSIIKQETPSLSLIPKPYSTIIKNCLIKNANKRTQKASDLILLLNSQPRIKHTTNELNKSKKKSRPLTIKNKYVITGISGLIILSAGIFFTTVQIKNNLIRKNITIHLEQNNHSEAISLLEQLPNRIRKSNKIVKIFENYNIKSKIDSLSILGKTQIEKNNYDEALKIFYLIIKDYDPENLNANNQINILQKLIAYRDDFNIPKIEEAVNLNEIISQSKTKPRDRVIQPILMTKETFPSVSDPTLASDTIILKVETKEVIDTLISLGKDHFIVKYITHKEEIEYNAKNNRYISLVPVKKDSSIFKILLNDKIIEHYADNGTTIKYRIIEDSSNPYDKNMFSYKINDSRGETYAFAIDEKNNLIIILKSSGRQKSMQGIFYYFDAP